MTHDQFAEAVLSQLTEAQREGNEAIARRAARTPTAALQRVAEIRNEPAQDLREFVLGREPVWADLGPDGYAVHREFEDEIGDALAASDSRALILTGTGGSGKSTTHMRFG